MLITWPWLSETTPRPMAVARNGSPVASINPRSCASACEKAAPLPTTTSGLRDPMYIYYC